QHVEVTDNQGIFGDDRQRLAKLRGDLQAGSGQPKPPLGRLVAVGDARKSDRLRLPSGPQQKLSQQRCGRGLDDDLRLKIEPGTVPQVLMRRTSVTVGTAMGA